MTRKRYIKLAMSYGVSRNKANELANNVSRFGTYEDLKQATALYRAAERIVNGAKKAAERVEQFFVALSETVCAAADALSDFINRVHDAISNMNPRQRYKAVKRLGPDTYPIFFNRPHIYHCRNNC
jgi:hypothetical protein